jgi:hypothetical protein
MRAGFALVSGPIDIPAGLAKPLAGLAKPLAGHVEPVGAVPNLRDAVCRTPSSNGGPRPP